MFGDAIRFMNVPQKAVDLDILRAFIDDENPKRINFASHHSNALRKSTTPAIVGRIVLPFDDTIESIARNCMGMDRFLFPSRFGNSFYRQIHNEAEYSQIASFIEQFRDLVFLRDTLDLSVALSMHETGPGVRTMLGEHEYQVKYRSDSDDAAEHLAALTAVVQQRLAELPFFRLSDYVCAIPSSKPFVRQIIASLVGFTFTDISSQISWDNKDGSLKNIETAEEKLDMIQSWGFRVTEGIDLKNKTILLLDDIYQSGVTMQYVAMRLKEAGAKRVFGMAIVKSLGY